MVNFNIVIAHFQTNYNVCADLNIRKIRADPPGDGPAAQPLQGGLGAHDPDRHRRGQGTGTILPHYFKTFDANLDNLGPVSLSLKYNSVPRRNARHPSAGARERTSW